MHRFLSVVVVIGAILAIVSVSLGAKIYRWEMIAWPSVVIFWVATAWIYETMARDD